MLQVERRAGEAIVATIQDRISPVDPEFARHIPEIVDEIMGGLSQRDRAIIQSYLARKPNTEIGRTLGCHRATVGRVIDRFRDQVARLLKDTRAD